MAGSGPGAASSSRSASSYWGAHALLWNRHLRFSRGVFRFVWEHLMRSRGSLRAVLMGLVGALGLAAGPAWCQPVGATWGGPYEIYEVRAGDTVENIAARFGVAPELIYNLNVLSPSAALDPGQDLAIPLPGGRDRESAGVEQAAAARQVPPRYAVVMTAGKITREPGSGGVLYAPAAGTRIVVKVERGSHWGVVMVDGSIGWIPKSCVEVSEETIAPERLQAMLAGRYDVVQEASRYLGVPYRYGGSLPGSVDCSLLVQAACGARGIRLPRTAADQFEVGRPVSSNELMPGDRLYFVDRSGRINHAGIYTGDGQFIHASSRRGCVAVDSLSDGFYWSRFAGARRS